MRGLPAIVIIVLVLAGCAAPSGYLNYFKEGTSDWQYESDLIACGARRSYGSLVYYVDRLPAIDRCMRSNGYMLYKPGQVIWARQGWSQKQHKRDYKACGVRFHSYHNVTHDLFQTDKCLRARGYQLDMVDHRLSLDARAALTGFIVISTE